MIFDCYASQGMRGVIVRIQFSLPNHVRELFITIRFWFGTIFFVGEKPIRRMPSGLVVI